MTGIGDTLPAVEAPATAAVAGGRLGGFTLRVGGGRPAEDFGVCGGFIERRRRASRDIVAPRVVLCAYLGATERYRETLRLVVRSGAGARLGVEAVLGGVTDVDGFVDRALERIDAVARLQAQVQGS